MFIEAKRKDGANSFTNSNRLAASEGDFTPKGVSICARSMAINMQPLRGWPTNTESCVAHSVPISIL